MNKRDFNKWFKSNTKVCTDAGCYHPDSQMGRNIRLNITLVEKIFGTEIQELKDRIAELESQINT